MRAATPDDIPQIVAMAHVFYEANKPSWPWSYGDMAETMAGLISSDDGFVRIAGDGFIAAVIQPNPLSREWLVAKEFLWWSNGSGPKLMRAFKEWALERGANEVQYSCPCTETKVRKFYSRSASPVEITYSEVI